jgi:NADH-quinone oxidoreductase subunit J
MPGFIVLALVMIASAIFTVTSRKPVYSVVGLLVNFIALAATYLTLQAEFLAVIQIVVYSGAILILFVFVIALLSSGVAPFEAGPDKLPRIVWPAVLFGAIALVGIGGTALRAVLAPQPVAGAPGDAGVFGSVADFGNALFQKNLLPFEVTAFVLMVAIIGVVLLAGDEVPAPRRRRRSETAAPREPIAR